MLQTTVSSQGQIFLPLLLRKKYNIESGDKIVLTPRGDEIILKHLPKNLSQAVRGILPLPKGTTIEKLHKKFKDEWEQHG